ncbi:MAG: hypothetical protein ABSF90_25925 [Syntrophobacteraceae bacterium]|jgi:hypothetical protein
MGKHDSSQTRVVPVFDQLYKLDEMRPSWLRELLSLPIGGNPICLASNCDFTIQEKGWGKHERKLDPPVALLSWLVRHPRPPLSGELSNNPVKAQKRNELIAGSEKATLEALALLQNNPTGEKWHLFEGQTQPDVFIQTPDLIIVIEGKRTELKPTTSTKWMQGRHQMLRHIDCAWEIAGRRKIVGFFIVEGNGIDGEVPQSWMEYAEQTTGRSAVASSLPHRGPEEQCGIVSCFAGVTTWQRVCTTFNIEWATLPDSTEE